MVPSAYPYSYEIQEASSSVLALIQVVPSFRPWFPHFFEVGLYLMMVHELESEEECPPSISAWRPGSSLSLAFSFVLLGSVWVWLGCPKT